MSENLSESRSYSGGTMEKVLQEIKDLKSRVTKLEDEVATLHELRELNHIRSRRESYSLSPPRILDFVRSLDDDDFRWSHESPKKDFEGESKAKRVAMMMNHQAWYGDGFLFEVMCQCRNYRPRDNHWFNSIQSFHTIPRFAQYIQSQKWFHHTCVLSIGYSDLLRYQSLNDKRTRWLLHKILNHMRDFGAEKIKLLSLPPARQMMKNVKYLRLCQTNNRTLQNVADTHTGVDFVNLDSFFLKKSDESFSYFEKGEVCVEILDNLRVRHDDDKYFIYVESAIARTVMDHVSNYTGSSGEFSRKAKGRGSANDSPTGSELVRYEERFRQANKRRREDSYSDESENRPTPSRR